MSCTMPSVRCCRRALTLAVILSALPFARADTITYSILPNPQPDTTMTGGIDNLSGTITFSGLSPITGTYTSANDAGVTVTSNLTITNSNVGPVSFGGSQTLASDLNGGDINLTPTGLVLDATSRFEISDITSVDAPSVLADWDMANNLYEGSADAITFFGNTMAFQNADSQQYLVGGQWTIATAVPEPGTIVLFGSALAAMGVIGMRRRRMLTTL
jgi:hypothetical protein